MKIAILEEKTVTGGNPDGDVNFDEFYSLGEVVKYPLTPQDTVVERMRGINAAIINKTVFSADIIEQCPDLRYIGLCATGYNNVDLKAADKHVITVTNSPAYSTDAVAQRVFSYILAFSDRTAEYDKDVHDGGWINSDTFSYFRFPTFELRGLTLGIIGMGEIGKRVSEIASAFGMNIIAYSRTPKNIPNVKNVSSIQDIFRESDIITLHCPLSPDTENIVNAANLSLCKNTAYIINTSRGRTVNEYDLANALNSGRIAGAAADVISAEPMKADNPLMNAKNMIITPHIAWAPVQTRKRLLAIAAENLRKYISGNPINVVNGRNF